MHGETVKNVITSSDLDITSLNPYIQYDLWDLMEGRTCLLKWTFAKYRMSLVNETNFLHDLFLVYFVNFIYNLYMFRTSLGPSSGGTIVFIQHWYLIFWIADFLVWRITSRNLAYQTVRTGFYTLLWRYSFSAIFGRNHYLRVPYMQIF
jgi:hypothetical protein